MSETVASALQMVRPDETRETRLFIRMIDQFFDCLNVKSPRQGILQRKEYRLPYKTANDHRFKVKTCYMLIVLIGDQLVVLSKVPWEIPFMDCTRELYM